MHKRTRVSLLSAPVFAGIGLTVQDKNQLFLAFIPIPSATRNLLFAVVCHPCMCSVIR